MDASTIRQTIKQHISTITGLSAGEIADSASYIDDLGLDSLSILELTVDLEYTFNIKLPIEQLPEIRTVDDAVRIVQEYTGAACV